MSEKIYAPWNEETVRLLRLYQENDRYHPYTCATDGCTTQYGWVSQSTVLIPTNKGWVCPKCGYIQKWARKEILTWISEDINERS